MKPADIVIIDDMANIQRDDLKTVILDTDYWDEDIERRFSIIVLRAGKEYMRIWRAPWRLGIPAAPNVGIALGGTDFTWTERC